MQARGLEPSSPVVIDPAVLEEAVDWLMRFQSGEADEAQQHAFHRWLGASEMHATAWQRAEEVMRVFGRTPPEVARAALCMPTGRQRRRGLLLPGVMTMLMPLAEALWRGESGSG